MPRPANTSVERDVFEKLAEFKGAELMYPATLKTLFAVRNSVYKFNKENKRHFRCTILDSGVKISERPKKPKYNLVLKEIESVLKTELTSENDVDANELAEKVAVVIREYFASAVDMAEAEDDEDEDSTSEKELEARQLRRKRVA